MIIYIGHIVFDAQYFKLIQYFSSLEACKIAIFETTVQKSKNINSNFKKLVDKLLKIREIQFKSSKRA